MERVKEIIKEYKQADFFERMCLFLQHRDLRGGFQKIEKKDQMEERISTSPGRKIIIQFLDEIRKEKGETK